MKQLEKIVALGFFVIVMLTGCSKFETAKVHIVPPDYNPDTKEATITAIIADYGGCSYLREVGFCYRLDTLNLPNLNDVYSHTEIVFDIKDFKDSIFTASTFTKTFMLEEVDTTYWVRAYVKNSAGVSYSDTMRVSTKLANNPEKEK